MLCGVIYIVLSQFTPFCKLFTIDLNIPSNNVDVWEALKNDIYDFVYQFQVKN